MLERLHRVDVAEDVLNGEIRAALDAHEALEPRVQFRDVLGERRLADARRPDEDDVALREQRALQLELDAPLADDLGERILPAQEDGFEFFAEHRPVEGPRAYIKLLLRFLVERAHDIFVNLECSERIRTK